MPRTVSTGLSILVTGTLAAAASIALVAFGADPATAAATHNPHGHLDALSRKGAVVSFRGWAADPDMSGTVRVVLTVDRTRIRSVLANQSRGDVGAAFPKFGGNAATRGR
jgi:hypothetical protein